MFFPLADDRYWKNVSPAAKEFVKACLQVDPSKRITADEAMKHAVSSQGHLSFHCFLILTHLTLFIQWLTEHKSDSEASHDLSVGLRDNYRARWKTAINAVRASTKFRTFAALAAEGKEGNKEGAAGQEGGRGLIGKSLIDSDDDSVEEGGVTPPTKGELYSDSSLDENSNNSPVEGERENGKDEGKLGKAVSALSDKLSNSHVQSS